MQKNSRLFRLTASVALTALLSDTVLLSPLAVAQPAPPPLPAPGQGRPDLNQNQGDPPARVGRIAGITGTVSFHNLGDTQWSAATLNYPVASGNAFWMIACGEAGFTTLRCHATVQCLIKINILVVVATFAQRGVKRASHYRQYPGPRIVSMELIEKPKSPHIRRLHDIFGRVVVSREPARQTVCRIQMRQG